MSKINLIRNIYLGIGSLTGLDNAIVHYQNNDHINLNIDKRNDLIIDSVLVGLPSIIFWGINAIKCLYK